MLINSILEIFKSEQDHSYPVIQSFYKFQLFRKLVEVRNGAIPFPVTISINYFPEDEQGLVCYHNILC